MADHPITPPPELVEQWHVEATKGFRTNGVYEQDIATQAARWGADQELEACCKTLQDIWDNEDLVTLSDVLRWLRADRRPKPLSLKERALQAWAAVETGTDDQTAMAVIRRALEALDD